MWASKKRLRRHSCSWPVIAELTPSDYCFNCKSAPENYGFDLRSITDKPIDLIKAGVVDPALVVKEVVTNAASVAANCLLPVLVLHLKIEMKNMTKLIGFGIKKLYPLKNPKRLTY
jgi:hypothetical protein